MNQHFTSIGERGCTNVIGKINVGDFDNAYFGIHRQQCTYMDPMQRLVLERTFEALLDAGTISYHTQTKTTPQCYPLF